MEQSVFTKDEMRMLEAGLIALLNNHYDAMKLVKNDKIEDALSEYIKEIQALHQKVCDKL